MTKTIENWSLSRKRTANSFSAPFLHFSPAERLHGRHPLFLGSARGLYPVRPCKDVSFLKNKTFM